MKVARDGFNVLVTLPLVDTTDAMRAEDLLAEVVAGPFPMSEGSGYFAGQRRSGIPGKNLRNLLGKPLILEWKLSLA